MQHNTDTFWSSITGGGIAALAYLFGGLDHMLLWLVIMMTIDFITGAAIGANGTGITSKRFFKGVVKKTVMILMVIVANGVDVITGTESIMRTGMILFLIANEGISIVENAGKLGVAVPTKLSKIFSQLRDKGDEE